VMLLCAVETSGDIMCTLKLPRNTAEHM